MFNFFLSSTFTDMQNERDAIQKYVLPRLSRMTVSLGQLCIVTDLRWGIKTENMDSDEALCMVLETCMRRIEVCNPYFIVLLGNNYGTVLSQNTINKFVKTSRAGMRYSPEELYGMSVTEIEIKHYLRLLKEKRVDNRIIICLRVSQGDFENNDRLKRIKRDLIEMFPDSVIEYEMGADSDGIITDVKTFSTKLTNKIEEIISKDYREIGWEEQQFLLQKDNIERYKNIFGGNDEIKSILDNTYTVLWGNDDQKRREIAAECVFRDDYSLFYFDHQEGLDNVEQIIHYLLWQINRIMPEFVYISDGRTDSDWLHNGIRMLLDTGKHVNLVFEIKNRKKLNDIFNVIPVFEDEYKGKFTCVISCDEHDNTMIGDHYINDIECNFSLEIDSIKEELEKYEKDLSDELYKTIYEKSRRNSRKYLELLIMSLTMVDKEVFNKCSKGNWNENWNNNIKELIDSIPDNEDEVAGYIVDTVKKDHPDFPMDEFIEMSSVFSKGFQASDYSEVLGITVEEIWEIVYSLPTEFIVDKNDFISVTGQLVKNEEKKAYIPDNIEGYTNALKTSSYTKARYYLILKYLQYCDNKQKDDEEACNTCLKEYAEYLASLFDDKEIQPGDYFAQGLDCFFEEMHQYDTSYFGWFWINLVDVSFQSISLDGFVRICLLLSIENINRINAKVLRSPSFPRALFSRIIEAESKITNDSFTNEMERTLLNSTALINRLRSSMNPGMHSEFISKLENNLKAIYEFAKENESYRSKYYVELSECFDFTAKIMMNAYYASAEERVEYSCKYRKMAMDILKMLSDNVIKKRRLLFVQNRILLSHFCELVDGFEIGLFSDNNLKKGISGLGSDEEELITICKKNQDSSEGKNSLAALYWILSIVDRSISYAEMAVKEFDDLYLYQKSKKVKKNIQRLEKWIEILNQ